MVVAVKRTKVAWTGLLMMAFCLACGPAMLPREVAAQEIVTLATGGPALTGTWSGGWHSQTTGHKGPLRADIRPTGNGNYTATFTGKFFKVIPFRYQMQLNVIANDGKQLQLAGSKKLGPLMGYYSYNATVTGGNFLATYRTKRDRGTFTLRR
jgi:hypothetical protein